VNGGKPGSSQFIKRTSTQRDKKGDWKVEKELKRKLYELEELLNKVKTTMMKDLKMGAIDAHANIHELNKS
jgi:hypothetical protein